MKTLRILFIILAVALARVAQKTQSQAVPKYDKASEALFQGYR